MQGSTKVDEPELAKSSGGAIILPILVVLIIGAAMFLPISPELSGSFSIKTIGASVQIEFGPSSYSKVALIKSYSVYNTKGSLTLPSRPLAQGNYNLTLVVAYGMTDQFQSGQLQPLLTRTFLYAADGTYSFDFLFFYMQETPGVPYIVVVHVSGMGIAETTNSILITP